MRYMRFHMQGDLEGSRIESDTIVSYEKGEAAVVEAAAALSNSRPGESAWPVSAENVEAGLLVPFDRARSLGVIPRDWATLEPD